MGRAPACKPTSHPAPASAAQGTQKQNERACARVQDWASEDRVSGAGAAIAGVLAGKHPRFLQVASRPWQALSANSSLRCCCLPQSLTGISLSPSASSELGPGSPWGASPTDLEELSPWSLWSESTVEAWTSPPREILREAAQQPRLQAKLSGGLVAGKKLAVLEPGASMLQLQLLC